MASQGQRHLLAGIALRITAVLLASALATATAASPDRPRAGAACAAYDLHLLTLLEDHGLVGEGDPKILAVAAMSVLEARSACRTGDHERGLRLYEAVVLDEVPITSFHRILLR